DPPGGVPRPTPTPTPSPISTSTARPSISPIDNPQSPGAPITDSTSTQTPFPLRHERPINRLPIHDPPPGLLERPRRPPKILRPDPHVHIPDRPLRRIPVQPVERTP